MRRMIAFESEEPDELGRVWMPGCFQWPADRDIYLSLVDGTRWPIGRVTDISREEDGRITGDIALWGEGISAKNLSLSFGCTAVDHDEFVFTKALIREVVCSIESREYKENE